MNTSPRLLCSRNMSEGRWYQWDRINEIDDDDDDDVKLKDDSGLFLCC